MNASDNQGFGTERKEAGGVVRGDGAVSTRPGHPFDRKLNEVLAGAGFDSFVEGLCAPYFREGCRRWNTFGRQLTNETRRIGSTPKTRIRLAQKTGELRLPRFLGRRPEEFKHPSRNDAVEVGMNHNWNRSLRGWVPIVPFTDE